MKARLNTALTPLVITNSKPKYAGDPDSPNFDPPSPLIGRAKFTSETEAALQKACAYIVADVKLNEEGLAKQPNSKNAKKTKTEKHDKHSSFSFQKARGFVPETAATSFAKTTSRGRKSPGVEKLGEGFEPLEPTTTRNPAQKQRKSSSHDDEALREIRNKLDLRPKTSAAACIDYRGDDTSGSSSQSSHATAITSANLTPGQTSNKGVPKGGDYFDNERISARVSGIDAAFKDHGLELLSAESSAMQDGHYNLDSNQPPLPCKTKSVPHLPTGAAGSRKPSVDLPAPTVKKRPSVPNITKKVQSRDGESLQPTYTSYYGASNVPANSTTNTRPGTSHTSRQSLDDHDYPPGRTSNVASSIRDYIRPGRPSTSSSRAQSRSRAPSLRSQRSRSSIRGNGESGVGWTSLRKKVSNMSLRTRSRSSSRSRPGYDDGDEYFIDVEKVDLNKNLPPLPGLDTWDSKPRHIGELMKRALPKRSKRDTTNIVIDPNGLERVMTVEEQVQRRQDLARAVMEKMTTGSMGSGDKSANNSRPVSSSSPRDELRIEPNPEQDVISSHRRHKSSSSIPKSPLSSPPPPKSFGQVNIFRGRSIPDDRHLETKVPPPTPKNGHSRGKSRKWIDLLGFGKGSKNRANAVQVN